jgi:hypothetical protein
MTTELSAAQLQERRDAARARWAKAREAAAAAGGAIAGGAAGAAGAEQIGNIARNRLVRPARAVLDPLRSAIEDNKRKQSFIDQRAQRAKSGVRSDSNFLSTARRAYEIKFRVAARAARRLAEHQAVNSETYFDSTSGETAQATLDLPGETRLREVAAAVGADQAQRFRAAADDLRENGRNSRKVPRAGSIQLPKKDSFSRTIIGKAELKLSSKTKDYLREVFAADAAQRAAGGTELSHFDELGIKSIDQLQQRFRELSPDDRKGFAQYLKLEASLPNITLRRQKKTVDVQNSSRVVPPHTTTVPGYPSDKTRKAMRAELLGDITARHRELSAVQQARADAEIGPARARAQTAARALRWLRPGSVARRGLVGAGLSAGVLAGAFAAARAEREIEHRFVESPDKLTKSGPELTNYPSYLANSRLQLTKADQSTGDEDAQNQGDPAQKPRQRLTTAHRLLNAAQDIENGLAEGVGRAFASWKDAATPEAIADPEAQGSLFDQLDEPLNDGMARLDDATVAGLTAPTRIQPPQTERDTSEPKPRLVSFGFNLRSPATEKYARQYRYSRVREITDRQRQNIRQIIIASTRSGDPPALTARRIRDVIGLTANQAAIVANYRAALEANDPRAATYALRDRRFDRTINAAIEAKKPLHEQVIDKLVDAYQRRFLAYRAMTIARTESLRAANNGHVQAVTKWLADHPDYTVAKTWISTEDERTRPDHVGLHRQTVIGLQTPFVCDSGETIRWPHDPLGAAKEVINCRCTFMTVLIPRSAAARHGQAAYGTPFPNFWSGPREPYDIESPDDLFGNPALEPA